MISAVVLPAGRAQRASEPNLSTSPGEKPPFQRILESALASALDEIVCVIDDLNVLRQQNKLADKRLLGLLNPAAGRDRGASMIAGLWATHPNSEGVMFLADDQPFIRTELINALIDRFHRGPELIVASSFNGEARNPLLFRRELFAELLQLTGDHHERALLPKYERQTALVEWQEELSFLQLDDQKSFERSRELT